MRRKRWAAVAITAAIVAAATIFSIATIAQINGHSIDPTDPENYNTYALRNNTTATLYVRRCGDEHCATVAAHSQWTAVAPGQAVTERIYWGDATPTVYVVSPTPTVAAGRRCLPISAAYKTHTTVDAPLNTAAACSE